MQDVDHEVEPRSGSDGTGNDEKQSPGFIRDISKSRFQIIIYGSQVEAVVQGQQNKCYHKISDPITHHYLEIAESLV
jgi:hypothetical protein